jgi:multiple sugar transport system substrate-binding protein
MKWIFLGVAVVLTLASLGVYAALPGKTSDVPVVYWVTDRNPARDEQVALFQQWLAENYPDVEIDLRLDMGNSDRQKKVVQGVSGVAGDIQDQGSGVDLRYFRELGLNTDITEAAEARGFSYKKTFPALREDLTLVTRDGDRRQYQFPCNVSPQRYYVNLEALAAVGMEPPPDRWTLDEFEAYGKEYVRRASDPAVFGDSRQRFVANDLQVSVLARSYGIDLFNETLTASGLSMPVYTADGYLSPEEGKEEIGFAEVLRRRTQWIHDDQILPSPADLQNLATASGYGGSGYQAFVRGDFAMLHTGRWGLIQFRKTNAEQRVRNEAHRAFFEDGVLSDEERRTILEDVATPEQLREIDAADPAQAKMLAARVLMRAQALPLQFGSAEPPYEYLPNIGSGTRAAMVYAGGKNQDLALYFLEYLASEEYNAHIIKDADGLPPIPEFADSDLYLTPEVDTARGIYAQSEWGLHEAWLRDMNTIAISNAYSPFVLYSVAVREINDANDDVMNDKYGPREAAIRAAAGVEKHIREYLDRLEPDDPLLDQFEEWSADQEKIDALKARGEKIPASLIRNHFYLRYYESIGMLEHDVPTEEIDGVLETAQVMP